MKNLIKALACNICKALGGCLYDKPEVQPCGTISLHMASSIILDKLEEMGCDAEIYLPDLNIKTYNLQDVKKSYELEDVSNIEYVAEITDCDDFAAKLYGRFAGLVWTQLHALNCFISQENKFYFIEPQTGKISEQLEGWQGNDIRFILMR